MDDWGGCIVALIVVVLVIGLIGAIIGGGIVALSYIGLTILIAIEFAAHGFAVLGVSSPLAAWLLLGVIIGGTVGLVIGFRRSGRASAVPVVCTVGALLLVGLLIASGLTPTFPHPSLTTTALPFEDKLAGGTLGVANGIQWTNAIGNQGAVFSSANSSRIEYPGLIPAEGTLEFWINVEDGYWYDNFRFIPGRDDAMIFSSDAQGGDVTWPGTTKIFVTRRGDVSFWMATNKYDKPHAVATEARNTAFRFGEWHAIGFSYGSSGQFIMVDGKIVASAPGRTQTFGEAGNHQTRLDIPTIGETASHFWRHHQYEGGFDGVLAAFRVSGRQQDWSLALGLKSAQPPGNVGETSPGDDNPDLPPSSLPDYMGTVQRTLAKTEALPTGDTLALNTPHGAVKIRNFYLDNPAVIEGGDIAIKVTKMYSIVYDPANTSFWLAIKGNPFAKWQHVAEQGFLETLNIDSGTACTLSVTSGVIYSPGDPNDGKSFPLTFCQSIVAQASTNDTGETQQHFRDLLNAYANAVRTRDANAVAGYYAPVVTGYFLQRDTPRAAVQSDFDRKFEKYPQVVDFAISDIQIVSRSRDLVTIRFDRRWDFLGVEPYSGDETEQMAFQQVNGIWQIIADCDVGLHWTNPPTHLRDESACLAVGSGTN